MGQRGTRPKADWLKLVDGNPGKRAIGEGLNLPVPASLPCPERFNEEQRDIWNKFTSLLVKVRAVAEIDQLLIERYVALTCEYRKGERYMTERPNGNLCYPITALGPRDENGKATTIVKSVRTLPQLKAMIEISNHLLRIETYFGITPSARAAWGKGGGGDSGEFDPFLDDD